MSQAQQMSQMQTGEAIAFIEHRKTSTITPNSNHHNNSRNPNHNSKRNPNQNNHHNNNHSPKHLNNGASSHSPSVIQDLNALEFDQLASGWSIPASAPQKLDATIALAHPGSAFSIDSPFYIERSPIETETRTELLKSGALIRIRAPEKLGKTSLMERVLDHAKQQQLHVVRLNLQQVDSAFMGSLKQFLRWFCANVTKQLGIKSKLDDYWDDDLGSKVSCTTYLQSHVLEQLEQPLVIAIDELQRLFEYAELAQDFLPMLRVWHEEAKNLQTWAKLHLMVVYSTELYIPLQVNQSPFNVGVPIHLPKFTLEQCDEFAQRHQIQYDWRSLQPLWHLVNGHPYLLHLAFYTMVRHQIDLTQLLTSADKQDGIYRQHLHNYLTVFQSNPELAQLFHRVIWADEPVPLEAIAAYKLESMGLVQLQGDRVVPSCELYRRYFRDRLVTI
jgi:hypothetical protein